MNIITGYRGEPHVTSQQERDTNVGIFGSGTYIVNLGSNLAATVVSANEIQISNGMVMCEGCTAEIAKGTSESLTIENGTQGMMRKDLIVARYTRDARTGIEDMQLVVITGTPASSSPSTPSYNTGSISNGDTLVDFPLYVVNLSGITVQSVTRIPDIITIANTSDVSAVQTALNTLSSTVSSLSTTLTNLVNKVGNVAMGTTATTVTGAIKELLTKINNLTSSLSTTNSNVSSVSSRTTALENKATAIVGTYKINVDAGQTQYLRMHALSMYVVIINAGTTDNNMRGLYLVGVTNGNVLGIKAVSAASSVAVTDGGNGLIKFVNNSSTTMRLTIICTYGTSI